MTSRTSKKRYRINSEEIETFRDAMKGTRPIQQDTIQPYHAQKPLKLQKRIRDDLQHHSASELSDAFEPEGVDIESGSYAKPGTPAHLLRRLRKRSAHIEAFLDLHGLTAEQAKNSIERFIQQACWEKMRIVAIIHGKGTGILKERLYFWLPQHPHVLAFRQAEIRHGGSGAVAVLLKYL